MFVMLLAAVLKFPAPIVVPAVIHPGIWMYPVSVDGKRAGFFCLSLDSGSTVALEGATTTGPLQADGIAVRRLAIGGYDCGAVNLYTAKRPANPPPGAVVIPADGLIGMDVLSKMAIGLDWDSGKLTIWPGGKLSPADARAWVMGGARWPGESRAPTATTINLVSSGEIDKVHGTLSGTAVDFAIDVLTSGAMAPMSEVSVEDGLNGGLSAVNLGFAAPWTIFARFLDDSGDGPSICLKSLLSVRVIMDFPAKKLYRQQLSDRAMAELCLSKQLPFEVRLVGTKLLVSKTQEFWSDLPVAPEAKVGDEVVAVGGVSEKELVAIVKAGVHQDVSRLLSDLKDLGPATKYKLKRAGKEFAIKVQNPYAHVGAGK